MRPDRAALFLSLVEPELNSGCHLWLGFLRSDGYGQFWDGGRYCGAHRIAWAIAHGQVAVGSCVLHRCDTPACVNPDHLFVGSNRENIADRVAKRRSSGGSHKGEAHRNARLRRKDVIQIRRLLVNGDSYESVAALFSISPSHARNIASGHKWGWLTDASPDEPRGAVAMVGTGGGW